MRNTTYLPSIGGLGLLALLSTGCSQSQDAAYVRDDVYDRPDPRTITASVTDEPMTEAAPEKQDDYYSSSEAKQYANPRGYYDMAYNDPYYYGYDRYGFGGMYGNQWGYNSWNNGWGGGWNNGFGGGYDPYGYNGFGSNCGCNNYWNGYGWQTGYSNGWPYNSGFGCNNGWGSPYSYGAYNGYGYYGYGGGCYGCYQPIVTVGEGWGSGVVYGHRGSFGGGVANGSSGNGGAGPRMAARDQISLLRPSVERTDNSRNARPAWESTRTDNPRPAPKPEVRPVERPRVDRSDRPVRELPTINDRNNGGTYAPEPSRNTGGGGGGVRPPR